MSNDCMLAKVGRGISFRMWLVVRHKMETVGL